MTGLVDHLKVMNDALSMIGAGKIGAEDEDSELADQVVPTYYLRLRDSLGKYEWSFAARTYRLDVVAEIPENDFDTIDCKFMTGWRHAYAIPGTALGGPRCVLTDPRVRSNPFREFMVEQNRIYADRSPLWATFTVLADPNVWTPGFRIAQTKLVAADLCVPITHDSTLAMALRTEGEGSPQENGRGGLIGRAMGQDASTSLNQRPNWTDPLSTAHMS